MPGSSVIRLFRFRPVSREFDSIIRDVLVPDLRRLPGVIDVYTGRQGPDELGPRLIASVWESRRAMAAAVGETFRQPKFHPELLNESSDRELEFLPLAFGLRFQRDEAAAILRLGRGQVRPLELDSYVADAREGTLADSRRGRGPLALYLAPDGPDRFVTLSLWADWTSLQEATGGNVRNPTATRHAERLIAWEAAHFEALPNDPDPIPVSAPLTASFALD
ncbi:MAG: hypothetical protein ACJ761_00910 [Chloroflexota bacterium]